MAASVRILLLFLVGCVTTDPSDMKARFPDFYSKLHARVMEQFHGEELARRAELGHGTWRAVVRMDIDYTGDVHEVRLLKSSGFNGLDEEAVAAARRVKEHVFPPEAAVDADQLAHVPVEVELTR